MRGVRKPPYVLLLKYSRTVHHHCIVSCLWLQHLLILFGGTRHLLYPGVKLNVTNSPLFPVLYNCCIDNLQVLDCISVYGMGSLHVLEGTMNAERYIKVLEQHMLPSRLLVFQQDNVKPHTAAITTAWLYSRRVQVLNWPACSPDLSPIDNIWHIIKWKIRQRVSQTLQQLETYKNVTKFQHQNS